MRHDEERKYLLRFLKEKGVYSKFIKYISNSKHYNMQRNYPSCDSYSLDWGLETFGAVNIISVLITWDSTDEGYEFWHTLCKEFDTQLNNKMKED